MLKKFLSLLSVIYIRSGFTYNWSSPCFFPLKIVGYLLDFIFCYHLPWIPFWQWINSAICISQIGKTFLSKVAECLIFFLLIILSSFMLRLGRKYGEIVIFSMVMDSSINTNKIACSRWGLDGSVPNSYLFNPLYLAWGAHTTVLMPQSHFRVSWMVVQRNMKVQVEQAELRITVIIATREGFSCLVDI